MMVSAVEHPVGHSLCCRFQPAKLAFFFKKSASQPAGCEKTTNFLTEIKEKLSSIYWTVIGTKKRIWETLPFGAPVYVDYDSEE